MALGNPADIYTPPVAIEYPRKNELWRKRSRQESASATRQQEGSSADRVAETLVKASRPHSAPRISLQCAEMGTLKSSVPTSAREDGTSEGGFEVTPKPDHKKAGVDEDQKTGSPRAQQSFVAARPAVNDNAWRSPSPIRRSKAATSNDRSFSSGLAADTRRGSVTDGPSSVRPAHERTNEPKNASDASSKEKSTATGGSRRKRRQQPSEHNETAVIRKIPGGNNSGHDGNGHRNIHRDTAPNVLLAREAEAAVRRAEREAAAREKEEREMQLSSSFRAKEVFSSNLDVRRSVPSGFEAKCIVGLLNPKQVDSRAGNAGYTHGSQAKKRLLFLRPRGC